MIQSPKARVALTALGFFGLTACGGLFDGEDRFVVITGGNNQFGRIGSILTDSLRVAVRSGGRPVEGAEVSWLPAEGDGTVSPSRVVTGPGGVVRSEWTLGDESGPQFLEARSGGARPATFIAFAARPLTFESVVAGEGVTCGIADTDVAFCWGRNADGQVGDGSTSEMEVTPIRVASTATFSVVSASGFSCGLTPEGVPFCWGEGVAAPQRVETGGVTFEQIDVGFSHVCALDPDGVAYCWGDNSVGQIGNGGEPAGIPVAVEGDLRFSSIRAGGFHTCGVTTDGDAYCWGDHSSGQVGVGDTAEVIIDIPQLVAGGLTWSAIAAGTGHTCALTLDGETFCWGSPGERIGLATDAVGPCRSGSEKECVNAPAPAAGALRFSSLTAGAAHTCALDADGAAFCWGKEGSGRLGTGTGDTRMPTEVVGDLTFVSISAGDGHTCGLRADGEGFCWGSNAFGELGTGVPGNRDEPTVVIGEVAFDEL